MEQHVPQLLYTVEIVVIDKLKGQFVADPAPFGRLAM